MGSSSKAGWTMPPVKCDPETRNVIRRSKRSRASTKRTEQDDHRNTQLKVPHAPPPFRQFYAANNTHYKFSALGKYLTTLPTLIVTPAAYTMNHAPSLPSVSRCS
jgi:hypothetical protein